ncbi:MAG: hypothetical protein MO853_12565 [Candidatus Protistobacter heckmanni]|nr:hypothetical protein [Candidatus Protistobacter heckmanni]
MLGFLQRAGLDPAASLPSPFDQLLRQIDARLSGLLVSAPKKLHFVWLSDLKPIAQDYMQLLASVNSDYEAHLWVDTGALLALYLGERIRELAAASMHFPSETIGGGFLGMGHEEEGVLLRAIDIQNCAYHQILVDNLAQTGANTAAQADELAAAVTRMIGGEESELTAFVLRLTRFADRAAGAVAGPVSVGLDIYELVHATDAEQHRTAGIQLTLDGASTAAGIAGVAAAALAEAMGPGSIILAAGAIIIGEIEAAHQRHLAAVADASATAGYLRLLDASHRGHAFVAAPSSGMLAPQPGVAVARIDFVDGRIGFGDQRFRPPLLTDEARSLQTADASPEDPLMSAFLKSRCETANPYALPLRALFGKSGAQTRPQPRRPPPMRPPRRAGASRTPRASS